MKTSNQIFFIVIINVVLLILLISCRSEQFSLINYQTFPVKFAKQSVVFPENKFKLYIPKNWKWKIENYDNTEILDFGIHASSEADEKKFINIISVEKFNGLTESNNIKIEFLKLLEIVKENSTLHLIDSGETNIFTTKSYYIHNRSNSDRYGGIEQLTIITEDIESDKYYLLTASASRTKDLKMNMAMMVKSIMTFKQGEQIKIK